MEYARTCKVIVDVVPHSVEYRSHRMTLIPKRPKPEKNYPRHIELLLHSTAYFYNKGLD